MEERLDEQYPYDNNDENNNIVNHYGISPLREFEINNHLNLGYETESFQFLQDMGLIQKSEYCTDCNESMSWRHSGTVDLFEWICPQCGNISNLRQYSHLETINCSYNKILGILRAWCKSKEIEKTSIKFGVEPKTVMKIFSMAGQAAEKHVSKYMTQWQIGGPGVIVLIDTFPESSLTGNKQSNRPILCVAELKGFPLTIAFHPLQIRPEEKGDHLQMMKSKCQSFIRDFVHPDSAVVSRRYSNLCSYNDILSNQPQFKVIASNEGLLKHESVGRNLHTILSTIWERALFVCLDAQYYPHDMIESFLLSHMWQNKFGDNAFPLILREISHMVTDKCPEEHS